MMLLALSCREDYERQLNAAAYRLSDSMYIAGSEPFNRMADSLCTARKEQETPALVDSILRVRREQIRQLRSLE